MEKIPKVDSGYANTWSRINNRKNITQNLLSKNSSIITEKLLSLECIRNALQDAETELETGLP